MSDLLKKDAEWTWSEAQVDVLTSVKRSLVEASVLALPDAAKRCDYFAISSALLQRMTMVLTVSHRISPGFKGCGAELSRARQGATFYTVCSY